MASPSSRMARETGLAHLLRWCAVECLPRLRRSTGAQAVHGSNTTENQKNDNDKKNKPQAAGRCITPFTTVRPARQRPDQRQNQDNDQYSSNHCFAPSLTGISFVIGV